VLASNLYVWHSSGYIQEAIRLNKYSDGATLDRLSSYAIGILSSSISSTGPIKGKQNPHQLFEQNEVDLLHHYTQHDGKDGVTFEDHMGDVEPQLGGKTLYGDDPTLENVSQLYYEKAMTQDLPLFSFTLKDNRSGTMVAVEPEEKSCLYTTLSHHLYGSAKYYWKIRLAVSHIILQLSFLHEKHAVFQQYECLYLQLQEDATRVMEELEEDADGETKKPSGPKHLTTMIVLNGNLDTH
jgi:hypothetical protein